MVKSWRLPVSFAELDTAVLRALLYFHPLDILDEWVPGARSCRMIADWHLLGNLAAVTVERHADGSSGLAFTDALWPLDQEIAKYRAENLDNMIARLAPGEWDSASASTLPDLSRWGEALIEQRGKYLEQMVIPTFCLELAADIDLWPCLPVAKPTPCKDPTVVSAALNGPAWPGTTILPPYAEPGEDSHWLVTNLRTEVVNWPASQRYHILATIDTQAIADNHDVDLGYLEIVTPDSPDATYTVQPFARDIWRRTAHVMGMVFDAYLAETSKAGTKKTGNPGLAEDEHLYRLSKAQEGEELKVSDARMTWKEIASQIGWRYGVTDSGIKLLEYARNDLKRLEQDDPEGLLAKVEEVRRTERKET